MVLIMARPHSGKVAFGTGTCQKAFSDFFFGLILNPPRYICFYSEKGKFIGNGHFFPRLHGLLRKRGGTGTGIRVLFPVICSHSRLANF